MIDERPKQVPLGDRAVAKVICPRCKARPGQKCFRRVRLESWRPPVTYELYRPHQERTRACTRLEVREAAKEQGLTQAELRRRVSVENTRLPYDTDARLAAQALQAWDRQEQAALTSWLLRHGDVLWEAPGEVGTGTSLLLREDRVDDVQAGEARSNQD